MPPKAAPIAASDVRPTSTALRRLYFFLVQLFENEPRATKANPKAHETLVDVLVELPAAPRVV